MLPALYLLPVTLGDTPVETVLPSYNKEVILGIRYFIVEDVRSARRFLKKVDREIDIDSLTFYTLNKHTSPEDISGYLIPLEDGNSMGVISEAGCPAVADPGADVVAIAQRKNLRAQKEWIVRKVRAIVDSAGGAFFDYIVGYGFRFQRTKLCFSWIFAY